MLNKRLVLNDLHVQLHLVNLQVANAPQVLGLQKIILDSLPPEKKTYIIQKSPEKVHHNLSAPNLGIGVFDQHDQLVAMGFLLEYVENKPINGLTVCPTLVAWLSGVKRAAVVGSVMVHPDFRQHGLMLTLLEALRTEAIARHYPFIVADVTDGNTASQRGFTHSGYSLVVRGVDPADGTPVLFMERKLAPSCEPVIDVAADLESLAIANA